MAKATNPMDLVSLAARGLAGLEEEDLRSNQLRLELEVSVWLQRSGAELTTVPRALLALRRALLEVSELDSDKEPVPLVIAQTEQAVPNLCVYLHGLIRRGASSVELDRPAFVEGALAHLSAAAAGARRTS